MSSPDRSDRALQTDSSPAARAAARVVGFSVARPWLILLLALALTVLSLLVIRHNIGINTDTTDMLSPELSFRKDAKDLSAAFPQRSGTLVIVVDGATADQADDAVAALAETLSGQPVFTEIFEPSSHPFFRSNGLLYLDRERLFDLTDRLATAQPFIATLAQDPSLAALVGLLGDAIEESGTGRSSSFDLEFTLTEIASVIAAQDAGEPKQLSWRAMLSGKTPTPSERRRILLAKPVRDYGSLQPAKEGIRAVRAAVSDLGYDADPQVRVRITGSAALADEELRSVRDGMGLAGILSMTLVVGLLLLGLRSVRLALATLGTLVLGLIWTAGFAAGTVGDLNLISVAFAVLFIGLSVDFGIHFGLRYREGIDADRPHADALVSAGNSCGGSLSLCAVAAAIGFFSFLPTDYVGLAELGLISGASMFIALTANLSVLPALLCLIRPTAKVMGLPRQARVSKQPTMRSRRSAGLIVLCATLVGAAAIPVAMQTRFDFDPLNLKDPDTESVSTMFDLMSDPDTTPYMITVLADSLAEAEALGEKIGPLPEVEDTRTLTDLVPPGQDEKMAAIEDVAFLMQPVFFAPTDPPPSDPGTRRAAWREFVQVVEAADSGAIPGLKALKEAIHGLEGDGPEGDGRDGPANGPDLAELERRMLTGFHGRLDALLASLEPSPITLDTVPETVRDQYVADDGRARLDVYPSEDVRDRAALERFVSAVREFAPRATGSPVIILEAGETVVRAFIEALGLSVGLIAVLLVALLRSLRDTLLVFAPLGLAALLTLAASVLLAMPMNFANVIVLPLLFGLGVASGIHFVLRERDQRDAAAMLQTSTPRAVVLSALTTIGSFGSIALSSHPGTSSMGILLTVALVLTLICTLVVLPALMDLLPRRRPAST